MTLKEIQDTLAQIEKAEDSGLNRDADKLRLSLTIDALIVIRDDTYHSLLDNAALLAETVLKAVE